MIPRLRRLRVIILHRTPVREKDRVVEVFSREEGRLKLLAAGVQRFPSRRVGHLEPLLESEIVVSASSRGDSIRDARVLHAFPALRENLDHLRVAYRIVRLLHEGTGERLADAQLYDAARSLLSVLDGPRRVELFLRLVALSADVQLLVHLGLLPDLYACSRCRRRLAAGTFTFDRRSPGFLCDRCTPRAGVPAGLTDAVKLLRLLAARAVPEEHLQVSANAVTALRGIVQSLWLPISAQIGIRP